MPKKGVDIRHVIKTPDLDSSVCPTAEQLMRAISEDKPSDDVLVTGATAQRAYILV